MRFDKRFVTPGSAVSTFLDIVVLILSSLSSGTACHDGWDFPGFGRGIVAGSPKYGRAYFGAWNRQKIQTSTT